MKKNSIEEIKTALFSVKNLSKDAISTNIKKCGKYIRQLNAKLKKAPNLGVKNQVQAQLGLLYGFRTKFKTHYYIGGGKVTAKNRVQWRDQHSAFANRMRTGVVINLAHKDLGQFFDDAFIMFRRRINNILKKEEAVKVNATFCGEFKVVKSDQEILEFKYLNSKYQPIWRDTNIQEWFNTNVKSSILTQLEEFQERDSGWALYTIINVTFNINKFTPQRGSSYIILPKSVADKKACINVKNNDDACFAWAVTSALYPAAKNVDRPSSYPDYTKVLNLEKITMPMTIKQIPRFEQQNNISVNVYALKLQKGQKQLYTTVPVYLTKSKQERHVNLLLIQNIYINDDDDDDDDENNINVRYHYVWIKDLSRLVSSQLSKNCRKKHICDRCLHYFHSVAQLELHSRDCEKLNECRIRLPEEGKNNLLFKNFMNKERQPFVIYADLESILVPTNDKVKYQQHVPCSVGYYVKCSYDDSLSFYTQHTGEDCIEWFVQQMAEFAENLETVFLCDIPMDELSEDQQFNFKTSTHCHICEKKFTNNEGRVRDHDHLTGKFRGAAHNGCNLNYRDKNGKVNIPVVFHNFSGYDSHFIVKDIATKIEGRIELLPTNMEKFISFTKHVSGNIIKFRFIDSLRFLASSLDKLASSLISYPILKSEFKELGEEQFKLLSRKGVFPYEYLDSWNKLEELNLPDISKFYSKLSECGITNEDYEHAQSVWHAFGCKNLKDYTELYMKTDVLLLADVFENFRNTGMSTHKLDPAHYYTLPGYTWDAMLKYTKVNLELLTEIDMLMFVERGIRGGLSQCSHRHAKANNKYMSNYNPNQPSNYLMYFDIINQYGWAMNQHLPYGGFEWLENVQNFNVFDIADDASEGYIVEVDLKYPSKIHDAHSDFPFCPEHKTPPNTRNAKLLATLYDKERYVIHYRSLKQCLSHGLELTKIHRVLKFKQSPWLKSYIDLNTTLRQAATSEFDKNFYKLMNNAVFGKTMENVRKYSNVKLVTKWGGRYGAETLISSPGFKSSMVLEENLAIIELNKTEIWFNKPIYVGMAILDIAKLTTYDFHYNFMLKKFGCNARVAYTDTDSLIYEIKCDDIYEVMRSDALQRFDTSDYPKDNVYNIPQLNKKVLGMMKDEYNGKVMTEFIGLKSKMYATRIDGKDTTKTAKGVKKCIIKNRINFDDYLNCLNTNQDIVVEQDLIQSKKHCVHTIVQEKIALNPHDDKRYICSDGISTLSWGHYSIMET
jgi:hypothetical protein